MTGRRTFQASIRNLTYKLRKFDEILNDVLLECVQQDEKLIVSMVRDIQLYERGENGASRGDSLGNGQVIWDYAPYAPRTIQNKKKAGQPADRVTLRKTGKFYDSLYLHIDEDGFSVESTDSKADKLKAKYGEEILRLSDYHFKQYLDFLRKYRLAPMLKKKLMEGVV